MAIYSRAKQIILRPFSRRQSTFTIQVFSIFHWTELLPRERVRYRCLKQKFRAFVCIGPDFYPGDTCINVSTQFERSQLFNWYINLQFMT